MFFFVDCIEVCQAGPARVHNGVEVLWNRNDVDGMFAVRSRHTPAQTDPTVHRHVVDRLPAGEGHQGDVALALSLSRTRHSPAHADGQ